jgi:hypothetical protein
MHHDRVDRRRSVVPNVTEGLRNEQSARHDQAYDGHDEDSGEARYLLWHAYPPRDEHLATGVENPDRKTRPSLGL